MELYDLIDDPAESKNPTGDPVFADQLEVMKARLKATQTATSDPCITKWDYE